MTRLLQNATRKAKWEEGLIKKKIWLRHGAYNKILWKVIAAIHSRISIIIYFNYFDASECVFIHILRRLKKSLLWGEDSALISSCFWPRHLQSRFPSGVLGARGATAPNPVPWVFDCDPDSACSREPTVWLSRIYERLITLACSEGIATSWDRPLRGFLNRIKKLHVAEYWN